MAKNRFIGICMPLLVFSILSYSFFHYVFTIQAFLNNQFSWNSGCTFILGLLGWISYARIMASFRTQFCTDDQTKTYHRQSDISLMLCEEKGQPLFCRKCKTAKPERTHHCKECQQCSPKMDHHCIWINGCVNDTNYKYFFLFVFYFACYAIWIEINTAPLLLERVQHEIGNLTLDFYWRMYKAYLLSIFYFWTNLLCIIIQRRWIPLLSGVPSLGLESISFHWYAITLLGIMLGLALLGFTLVHFYFIIKNKTSIEYVANRPIYIRVDFDQSGENFEVVVIQEYRNMYDRGLYLNWCSVMGKNPFFWPIPSISYQKNKLYRWNSNFENQVILEAKNQRQTRLQML